MHSQHGARSLLIESSPTPEPFVRRNGIRNTKFFYRGTALRASRIKGGDIVKAEQEDFTQLDALAKRTNCAILIVHHGSKGSAGLHWTQQAAGTFAVGAATESQVFVSRFAELDGAAPERPVQIRGRHSEDLEMVIRFRKETLDYEHVLDGGAATL